MTREVVALATQVGKVAAEVKSMDDKLDGVDKRLAVLEAIAITPARLAVVISVAASIAAIIFGSITAAAVVLNH
jgi:hypothetical protein